MVWRIIVLFGILTTGQANNCSEEAQNNCLRVFSAFETEVEESVIVPAVTEEEMRVHCQEYRQAKQCIAGLEEHCNTTDIALFRGRDLAYMWLCETAFDQYLKHRDCFALPEIHEEGRVCNDSLTANLNTLNSSDLARFRRKLCLYANNYLDCVENAVQSYCGSAAAKWQRTMDLYLLGPIVSLTGCLLDTNTDSSNNTDKGISATMYVIIGCIIALSIVITVILILMVMKVRKTRKQRSRSPYTSSGGPYVYYNNGQSPTAHAVYPGSIFPDGAQTGALPSKVAEPPPYDPSPLPAYSSNPEFSPKSASVSNVAGSIRSQPPDYRSQIGSDAGFTKSELRHN